MTLGISIHAPCTGSDPKTSGKGERLGISIHAPCTGSDGIKSKEDMTLGISIHAPCTGSDLSVADDPEKVKNFNPRSLHGERQAACPSRSHTLCISIHAPCTGSDHAGAVRIGHDGISIHAPCTGSDINRMFEKNMGKIFQSTLPARGATCRKINGFRIYPHFNPRSLHGERQNDTVRIPSL